MQITVNAPGAKTLADARPMIVDGSKVYVTVGGGEAALHIGGRIVATRAAEDMSTREAQQWAVEYTEGGEDMWAAVDVTNPAPAAPTAEEIERHAATVEAVRDAGSLLAVEADKLAAKGAANPGRYRHVGMRGKVTFLGPADPRHPANAAPVLRAQAERLARWSTADEVAYGRYVDDSISSSDGYVAPLSRAAWGQTLGA